MNLENKLKLAYAKMKQSKRILIIGHTSPDADALASISAILEISNNLDLETYSYTDNKIPGAYSIIPRIQEISSEEPNNLLFFDLIFIVDCGSLSRTNLEARIRTLFKAADEKRIMKRPYLIEFDHHQPQESLADLEVRLPEMASTTEIIYHFLKFNNLPITKSLANCILIGLITDTGHFLHSNSSQEVIAIASEMLLKGASMPKIINETVNNKSFSTLKIWGRVIKNMNFNQKTGLVFSSLTSLELKDLLPPEEEANNADLFGEIVSFLNTIKGSSLALFVHESNGQVKGSLRTNSNKIDVSKIAQNWGGGGHKKAAGFSVPGHLLRGSQDLKIII